MAAVTTSKILRIMKKLGMAPEIPEDLYHLIKKAVSMRKHLEANRKDRDGKFRLILVESRIHRLARYYKARQPRPGSVQILGVYQRVAASYMLCVAQTRDAKRRQCVSSAVCVFFAWCNLV